jgi:hypothetical protein
MKYLLIDNSNTRTKFQLADAEHLHDWTKWIPTADVSVVDGKPSGTVVNGVVKCACTIDGC